jgi:hypothetical protein
MFQKRFVVVSLANSFPVYLTQGKRPLFDNFQITGVDFHFSTTVSFAIRCESEAEAEVYIGGMLYVHPRFTPLTIIPVYEPVEFVPPKEG